MNKSKENIIVVNNLIVGSDHSSKARLLKNISFSIKKNKITALVGKSGSGKSLTALSVLGLVKYTEGLIVEGEVLFEDNRKNILEFGEKELNEYRGKKVSMIFQDPFSSFDPSMKCGEQLKEILVHNNESKIDDPEEYILNMFYQLGIEKRLFFLYPHMLSGGQLQRIGIIAAIISSPKMIIADEPTTNLDASSKKTVLDLLVKVRKEFGISVFFITHDLDAVQYIADDILLMEDGKIVDKVSIGEFSGQSQSTSLQEILKKEKSLDNIEIKSGSREKILAASHITKTFSNNSFFSFAKKTSVRALDNVSFDVFEGEVFGIIGESGSGKSTLARVLLNLIPKDSGELIFGGQAFFSYQNKSAFYNDVQIVFQNPLSSLNPAMSIKRLLEEAIRSNKRAKYSKTDVDNKLKWLLEVVNLSKDILPKRSSQISGGEGQRLSLARALAVSPRLIVLDESISSLDKEMQYNILELLLKIKNELGLTYIFITHDLKVARFFCDRILILHKGEVVEGGTTEDIYERPKHAYTKRLLSAILT